MIESLTISLINQENERFTFHVNCIYCSICEYDWWIDYVGELEKKESVLPNCEYTYGIDTPEKFVSMIAQDGIIEEIVLDELASYFDDWFTQTLLMEMKLKPTEEDVDNEILEKNVYECLLE